MTELNKKLYEYGIIPVIKISSADTAIPVAKALCAGGLPVAEVTYRTECASEAISLMKSAFPYMTVGAGTVLTPEQADSAIAAGADFIVSPGYNPRVVNHCIERGITIIPGCSTPSDIELAIEAGLDTVKFFPAEACGGIAAVKAMAAPYGNVKFIPTGGIDEKNLLSYLAFDKVLACGGSFMVSESLINGGRFDEITALTKAAMKLILGFKIAHLGINCSDMDALKRSAALFAAVLGADMPVLADGSVACFVGDIVELVGQNGRGTKGHIALGTNSVARAEAHFRRLGMEFIENSRTYTDDGKLRLVYLADELNGFAVHLLQL